MLERKIIRRGLEILKQIKKKDKLLKIIISENKFPPIMTIFLSYYKVGDSYVYDDSEYIFGEQTDPSLKNGYGRIGLVWTKMNTSEILKGKEYIDEFGWIFSYKQLVEELENYQQKTEEWHEKGYLQIGGERLHRELIQFFNKNITIEDFDKL